MDSFLSFKRCICMFLDLILVEILHKICDVPLYESSSVSLFTVFFPLNVACVFGLDLAGILTNIARILYTKSVMWPIWSKPGYFSHFCINALWLTKLPDACICAKLDAQCISLTNYCQYSSFYAVRKHIDVLCLVLIFSILDLKKVLNWSSGNLQKPLLSRHQSFKCCMCF